MEERTVGKSGLRVSAVGLGCNNFGGRIDFAGHARGGAQGARSRHHLLRHVRHLSAIAARQSEAPRRGILGDARARTSCSPPSSAWRWTTPAGSRAARARYIMTRGRGEPEAAQHRLDRPLSAPSPRSGDADRGDPARARRPRAPGQGALYRLLEPDRPGRWSRRMDRARHPGSRLLSPARTNTACSSAGSTATLMPGCEAYGLG